MQDRIRPNERGSVMKAVKTKPLLAPIRVVQTGELKVLRRQNAFLSDVELWLLNDLVNRNNWRFVNLEEHRALFAGTPILIAYIHKGAGIGDGHNFELRRDPKTGKARPSFTADTAERIVGSLSDDPGDIRLEEKDGVTWVVARGTLWNFYAPELVDKITANATQGRTMSVSIEALVEEFHIGEEGEQVEDRWIPLGTTILGDHVAPAVKDARIVAMQEGGSFEELKVRAASYARNNGNQKNGRGGSAKMNKKAMEQLAAKFEGYKVLAVSKDGRRVILLDQGGGAYGYTFGEEDQGEVIQAKIKPMELSVRTAAEDGEEGLSLDMDDILDHVTNSVRDQAKTIENLNKQLEEANAAVEAMKQAEQQRRVDSVKDVLTRTLEEIRENTDADVSELAEKVKELSEKAENYAQLEDSEGKFCGADQAKKDLLALHGELCIKKAKAQKLAEKNTYIWDHLRRSSAGSGEDDGGIAGLLARNGITNE